MLPIQVPNPPAQPDPYSSLCIDQMVPTLQAQFFVWLASDRKAKKILEIGCFSGMFHARVRRI